jgi:hypothetical protein
MAKQKQYLGFMIILLIAGVIISGCSSDTEYTPPSKVESTQSEKTTETETQKTEIIEPETKLEAETETKPPKTQILNVGETATDNELRVTVNNVDFISMIDELDNQFMIAEAPSGKQYAVVDITVENILPDKTQSISTMMETTILDQDGYNYDIDFGGFTALDKSFKDGDILPGMKKRGQIAYLVPTDTTDLKFIYKFDLFTGKTAVFDIK